MLHPALDAGEKKKKNTTTLCHAYYLIMKNLPWLVGSFLLLLSEDPLAISTERIIWQEEGHICKSPPFLQIAPD